MLQQGHDLRRERREGREPAAESGNHEQPPLRRQRREGRKKRDGEPDEVATDKVGGERAGRDRGEIGVELRAKPPAQHRAQAATEADGGG